MSQTLINLRDLSRPARPNNALFAPEDVSLSAKADGVTPVFDMTADALMKIACDNWQSLKNVRLEARADGLEGRVHFVATTSLLRFKDDVHVEFVDLKNGQSSVIIFSASRIGYSDLGTNRKRVEHWLETLSSAIKRA